LLEIQVCQDPRMIPYSRIIALDGKFAEILNGPLAQGAMIAESSPYGYNEGPPQLKQQYFTYLTTEARRSKLHLPYLLRLSQGTYRCSISGQNSQQHWNGEYGSLILLHRSPIHVLTQHVPTVCPQHPSAKTYPPDRNVDRLHTVVQDDGSYAPLLLRHRHPGHGFMRQSGCSLRE